MRAEQELLQAASDTLAARGSSSRDDGDYELHFPPMGRGGGSGKGRR